MTVQPLNGTWQYRIGQGKTTQMSVPFSRLAVGHSECERTFDLTAKSDKVFLNFDGITYYALVYLNGTLVGEMLPYSEYSFDVTHLVREKDNTLKVELEDIKPKFGPTEGWENFGGIIRDVSLVYKNESFIEDVFFKPQLCDDFKNALVTVEAVSSTPEKESYEIELFLEDDKVLSYCQDSSPKTVKLCDVKTWSPDRPILYKLVVKLLCDGKVTDTYSANVGFKELKCSRHRFVLNGKDIYLKGICKHEPVGDSGHCPTYDEIYSDLKMIKDMGCNFVRLVHYPHNKVTLDIADKIGLMVSEEPGLWWSDTSDEEVSRGSLEVLRRTILRDRNHASVGFWLCFNECRFTEKFLVDSALLCRKYDPTRLVSGANCMSDDDTLVYYNMCGFDFYTMHPYAPTFDRAAESARKLCDKPLLFTEWGGFYVYNNPHLLFDFMKNMYELYLNNDDDGALAGAFLWFFAELNDYNRGEPACTDGTLHEGVVDKYRKPTLIYDAFVKGMSLDENSVKKKHSFFILENDGALSFDNCTSLELTDGKVQEEGFYKYLDKVREIEKSSEEARKSIRRRSLVVGPVLESVDGLCNVPAVAEGKDSVAFAGCATGSTIVVTGLTTMDKAYPLGGEYGEKYGEITVFYTDDSTLVMPLCNGTEITTAFALNGSSRINPIAEKAARAAIFGYDKNFEQYVLNRLEIDIDNTKTVKQVEISSRQGKSILVYGVHLK